MKTSHETVKENIDSVTDPILVNEADTVIRGLALWSLKSPYRNLKDRLSFPIKAQPQPEILAEAA